MVKRYHFGFWHRRPRFDPWCPSHLAGPPGSRRLLFFLVRRAGLGVGLGSTRSLVSRIKRLSVLSGNRSRTPRSGRLLMSSVFNSPEVLSRVSEIIKSQGWSIIRGPYYNMNRSGDGVHVWSIKSQLSKAELEARGIKHDKSCKPGDVRTVRFLGVMEDGELTTVRHVTSSERKRFRRRPKKKSPCSSIGSSNDLLSRRLQVRILPGAPSPRSSVGQSTRLITGGSSVQVRAGLPNTF